jgi:hypothetical protein
MRTGGLNDILKALLDNDKKGISNQELIRLLQKIENYATEIYHAKYALEEKIKFNIDYGNNSNTNLVGRQDVKSLECIRKSIKKNLDLMHENIKIIFLSYLTQCGEGDTSNDI